MAAARLMQGLFLTTVNAMNLVNGRAFNNQSCAARSIGDGCAATSIIGLRSSCLQH
jgi:hypothetical protein